MPAFPGLTRLSLLAASVLAIGSVPALSQASSSSPSPMDGITNQPYTAEFRMTLLQPQTDSEWTGNKIIESRDSSGRTWIQSFQLFGSRTSSVPIATFLYIPSQRQIVQLFAGAKTADVHTFPGTGPIPTIGPCLGAAETTTEKLPGQTIHGVYAEGTRLTCKRPAHDGTGTTYTDVQETWIAPDLKIAVLSKFTSTDSRSGQTSTELVRLDRNEPDTSLFEIPADYTVKEQSLDHH